MEKKTTQRGFDIFTFTDRYGKLATESCIWLGCDKIELKWRDEKSGMVGWHDCNVESDERISYIANTRMHLTQKQVKELLPHLQKFAETGEI